MVVLLGTIIVPESKVALVTVSALVPLTAPKVAVMVTGPPIAAPVASPLEPEELLMVAIAMFDEDQVTWLVISALLPSEYEPVAVYCCVNPTGKLGLEEAKGATAIDTRVIGFTTWVNAGEVLPASFASPPYCAVIAWLPATRAEVLSVACPEFNAALPMLVAPSKNVTVPVAVEGVTVAVNVTF